MKKVIEQHLNYNSLIIITRLLITSVFMYFINIYIFYISTLFLLSFLIAWLLINRMNRHTFSKKLSKMRKLMLVYFLFQKPSYLHFDFRMYETIKKEKYTADSYWLYRYIYRREFQIENENELFSRIKNSFQRIISRIKIVECILIFILFLGVFGYLFTSKTPIPHFGFLILLWLVTSMSVHNLLMYIIVNKNCKEVSNLFENGKIDAAVKRTIFYIGMNKNILYKSKDTKYLKNIESVYMY